MPIDALRNELITSYYDNSTMLTLALSIDKFLADVACIYPYRGWFNGEVVAGPTVKRYWVSMILKYDYKDMPDPEGGMVLVRLGCKVFYKKFKQKVEVEIKDRSDFDKRDRPKTKIEPCWLIKIVIPKKFLENEKLQDLEILDQDIEVENVEDAMNAGMNDTSALEQPDDNSLGSNPANPTQQISGAQIPGQPTGGVNTQGKSVNG